MTHSTSVLFTSQPSGTAAIARDRLLTDSQMRRNHAPETISAHRIAAPVTASFADLASLVSADLPTPLQLSAAEQKQRAIQLAKSFKTFYLSEYNYLDDRRLAVAVIRPLDPTDPPQKICVDGGGNVSILALDSPYPRRLLLSRVAVAFSGVTAAFGTLLWIILS